MSETDALLLRSGSLELELSPAIGGAIRNFRRVTDGERISFMRESHSGETSVLGTACFPLVPYVNRIRGGCFDFRGRTVTIAPNMAGDISPLHGQGWLGRWNVEESEGAQALLSFDHPAGEWPWAYRATQRFSLDAEGFDAALTCTNGSGSPMPCGLGFHPYFPCSAETVIATQVECAWEIDSNVLPTAKVPATGRFDLTDRKVCGQSLDHGFGGWGGRATVTDPGTGVCITMTSPDAHFFQLYSPSIGNIFVMEPVTHANAALNAPESQWAELGMRVLEPGETMTLNMRIGVEPL
jgi:aldose 1-epimerase